MTLAAGVRAISRHTYDAASSFFNAAGTGLISREAEQAMRESSTRWDAAVACVRQQMSALLGHTHDHISMFHNTTSGIQRVLQRVQQVVGPQSVLLTCDAEYPGVIAAVDECWRGPVAMVEISQLIMEARSESVLPTLQRAFLLTRPRVIYISHVTRALGYPIDVEFFRFAKSLNPEVVIIVDGAQALGNVALAADLFDYVDFYVCSGHKWIGGKPTLGLVCAHPYWKIADPAQAYSRPSGSGGTGSIEILRAQAAALTEFVDQSGEGARQRMAAIEQHNRALASYFCELLAGSALPVRAVPGIERWPMNGIVALFGNCAGFGAVVDTSGDATRVARVAGAGRVMAASVQPECWVTEGAAQPAGPRIMVRSVADSLKMQDTDFRDPVCTVPAPSGGLLRFCFHHFHSSQDVEVLFETLCAARH